MVEELPVVDPKSGTGAEVEVLAVLAGHVVVVPPHRRHERLVAGVEAEHVGAARVDLVGVLLQVDVVEEAEPATCQLVPEQVSERVVEHVEPVLDHVGGTGGVRGGDGCPGAPCPVVPLALHPIAATVVLEEEIGARAEGQVAGGAYHACRQRRCVQERPDALLQAAGSREEELERLDGAAGRVGGWGNQRPGLGDKPRVADEVRVRSAVGQGQQRLGVQPVGRLRVGEERDGQHIARETGALEKEHRCAWHRQVAQLQVGKTGVENCPADVHGGRTIDAVDHVP